MKKVYYCKGTTRQVVCIGSLCFKIPVFSSWYLFLNGIIANLEEKKWVKFNFLYDYRMCPIFISCFGFMNIMPFCREIDQIQFNTIDWNIFKGIPVEQKIDSIKLYQNRIVAVDYG